MHGKELKENLDSRFFIPVKCMYTSDKIDVHDFYSYRLTLPAYSLHVKISIWKFQDYFKIY